MLKSMVLQLFSLYEADIVFLHTENTLSEVSTRSASKTLCLSTVSSIPRLPKVPTLGSPICRIGRRSLYLPLPKLRRNALEGLKFSEKEGEECFFLLISNVLTHFLCFSSFFYRFFPAILLVLVESPQVFCLWLENIEYLNGGGVKKKNPRRS